MSIRRLIVVLARKILGSPEYRLVKVEKSLLPSIQLTNHLGHAIDIYCMSKTFKLSYSRFPKIKRNITLFSIFGTCSKDIPESLRSIVSETIIIPSILPNFFPKGMQKQEAIMAYVSYVLFKAKTI